MAQSVGLTNPLARGLVYDVDTHRLRVVKPYLRRAARAAMRVRQIEPAELAPWHRAFVAATRSRCAREFRASHS